MTVAELGVVEEREAESWRVGCLFELAVAERCGVQMVKRVDGGTNSGFDTVEGGIMHRHPQR